MPPLLRIVALVSLAGAWTAPAAAQHPLPAGARPLHVRLAAADAVAVGTVARVGEGRIRIVQARALLGEVGSEFEIKRSPAAPPPLSRGARTVLLLRGARSPYLLVDEPDELVVAASQADLEAWTGGVLRALATGDDPAALLALYLEWLDGPHGFLRELAAASLLAPRAPFLPLSQPVAVARAHAALDPHAAPTARRVSALLATTRAEGLEVLLSGLPGPGDAAVVGTALRAGVARDPDRAGGALARSLEHPEPAVRRAALRAAPLVRRPGLRARVEAMAEGDPDPAVRREAQRVGERVGE